MLVCWCVVVLWGVVQKRLVDEGAVEGPRMLSSRFENLNSQFGVRNSARAQAMSCLMWWFTLQPSLSGRSGTR